MLQVPARYCPAGVPSRQASNKRHHVPLRTLVVQDEKKFAFRR